jgi:xanthine phosphoribosyltransferase
MEDRIRKDGIIEDGDVLNVGTFLNQQLDTRFIRTLGEEFYRLFKDEGVNKILTIEASGIGIACITAQYFSCPVVFAKKSKTSNISDDLYAASVHSYTHDVTNNVVVSKSYLSPADRVLIIDDFLANGCALEGLAEVCRQAGATVVGCGIVIEKHYQGGGDKLRQRGIRVESLAMVSAMEEGSITFC